MPREVTPTNIDERLAKLKAKFGEEAETFYVNTPGDYCVGTVQGTGTMTTEFGQSSYVDFLLEDGESQETEDVVIGKRYRVAFLGRVMDGRFKSMDFQPGVRFVVMNRGDKRNKANTQTYRNMEIQLLPANG